MRFLNTKDPNISFKLIRWYVPVERDRFEIGWELYERLKNNPDETFCCVAIEDNKIMGMALAYCRYKDIFIWQASAALKGKFRTSRRYVDLIFEGIKCWAKSKGFNRISGWPNRDKRIWQRRWGFMKSKENKNEIYLEI